MGEVGNNKQNREKSKKILHYRGGLMELHFFKILLVSTIAIEH